MGTGAGIPIPYCMGCCIWHCKCGAICGHMVGWAAMGAVCWATSGALCAVGAAIMGGLANPMVAMEGDMLGPMLPIFILFLCCCHGGSSIGCLAPALANLSWSTESGTSWKGS